MSPKDTPTVRQARLGAELRKMRERAGVLAREAAAALGTNQAKMSMMEAGRRGVSEERVRNLASLYSCQDATLIDALCAIAREHRGQFWWDEYRDTVPPGALDMSELEYHAAYTRSVEMLVIPGIFQTEDYTRALFGPSNLFGDFEIRVEHRMKRRRIFERTDPAPYEAIIHEAALRMRYGGRKVAKSQLEYLLAVADWPSVTLRVIPFSLEEIIGYAQSMVYAGGPVAQLDTVGIDTPFGGLYLDAELQLQGYRKLIDTITDSALDASRSKNLIHSIAQEM
ncbi:helix-turn-helix domain-containing protein [Actinacidiphila oryziradicis]|uniref:Helix-turn-helix domain-containing protein n=1 Tax=Actinacidiphila oryziradicis TaxID=2571141 RepID=A0A4U0T8S4_9ACTN|nr:helix-turn-helix transcriptional regulator [Actinacidiphila oryziradicis]TKA11565.1 helix-turn-helix domain-containing protein [Actinacidiphila oryziradicis]